MAATIAGSFAVTPNQDQTNVNTTPWAQDVN